MDPNLLNVLLSFGSGVASNLTTNGLKEAYSQIFSAKPDLERRITSPTSASDAQAALSEVAGNLEAMARNGKIAVDGATIQALRSATFNHQDGSIYINNTKISAPVLHTGGTGLGRTVLGGQTVLASQGTRIEIGNGAFIEITGNAGISQS